MRLAKFMASCGIASRRACEELITAGKVTVNGRVHTELGKQIDPDEDEILYKNRLLVGAKKSYYLLNKPTGYVCSAKDDFGQRLVYELVDTNERLFTVGRLDRASEGLIILTNDGEFAQKLSHPKYGLEKKYRVWVTGNINTHKLKMVEKEGIEFEGEFYRVKSLQMKSKIYDGAILNFVLQEGKNREIRKICKAMDLSVTKLKRTQIDKIRLKDLPQGSYRKLTKAEVEMLSRTATKNGPSK